MPPLSKIIELRELLAEKYPTAPPRSGGYLPTSVTHLDDTLRGGLPLGGMTEITCAGGGGLLLSALVSSTLRRRGLLALIDGSDAFDPAGFPAAALSRLLWVRSQSTAQAIQAADLLLRDGNLNLVVMDLRSVRAQELQKIPATSWYRLQRVVEPAATAFVVLTSKPLVVGARPRVMLDARFSLDAFLRPQRDLQNCLRASILRGQEEQIRQYA